MRIFCGIVYFNGNMIALSFYILHEDSKGFDFIRCDFTNQHTVVSYTIRHFQYAEMLSQSREGYINYLLSNNTDNFNVIELDTNYPISQQLEKILSDKVVFKNYENVI